MKLIIRRAQADADVREAIDYYLAQEGPDLAAQFIDDMEQAYRHVQLHQATGSPRYAHELNLPGLRFWALRCFPYLVFYMDGAEGTEVWRVLHGSRDIPIWMQGDVL